MPPPAPEQNDERSEPPSQPARVSLRVLQARPEPPARGELALEPLERLLLRLEGLSDRLLPRRWNPLAQTGAIACVTLILAIASGVPLLFWYSPSTLSAHASLEAMPFAGVVLRGLHRYSSDACVLFTLLHAARMLVGRRYRGARWLAWVSGVALLALLGFVGWLGYWLVWDAGAQAIAVGTARFTDGLPIFADPLGRSLLVDDGMKPLLFFVILFLHMLIPIGMAILLWLHLARLVAPRYLTAARLTTVVTLGLVLLAVVWPARSAPPARLSEVPAAMAIDAWYLWPLWLTERLGGGALWAIFGGGLLLSGLVPWLLGRGRTPRAQVNETRCNACGVCAVDCPFGAITMGPRTDDRDVPARAIVDPARCVGCGICVGSCDPGSIAVAGHEPELVRQTIDRWLAEAAKTGEPPAIAFLCGRSAGAKLTIDPVTGRADALPGYRVMPVPCAGAVHALLVERALRHGARGVLVVGCGPVEPAYRHGTAIASARLTGAREPALRTTRVDPTRVRYLQLGRTRSGELLRAAAEFLGGSPAPAPVRAPSWRLPVAGLATTALCLGVLGAGSTLPFTPVGPSAPELVVSFKHPGKAGEHCRTLTPEELAAKPVHMRQPRQCDRGRSPVRLRVSVDGQVVFTGRYTAGGIFGDAAAVGVQTIPVAPGRHKVRVELGETFDPGEWTHADEAELDWPGPRRRVVRFDRASGFVWP